MNIDPRLIPGFFLRILSSEGCPTNEQGPLPPDLSPRQR
nr:MAG TPA: hypothetical protein [Caudoviricetes sp.]